MYDVADVSESVVNSIDHQIGSVVNDIKCILQSLKEELGRCDSKLKPKILAQVTLLQDSLPALISPKEIELPTKGSIKQVQAHVTLT